MFCQECGTQRAGNAIFCSECGARLAELPVAAAPRTPHLARSRVQLRPRHVMKSCLMVSGALFTLVVTCATITAITSSHEPARSEVAEAARPIPADQAAFIRTVESFYKPYEEAENELQESALRPKRAAALAALLPDRQIRGWTGTLERLETDENGDALISIRPDGTDSITLVTADDPEVDTDPPIPVGSALYGELADMREGDRVVLAGTFAADEHDHLAERSETEAASMAEPDFVLLLTDVKKHDQEPSEEP